MKKILALLLCIVLFGALLYGCAKQSKERTIKIDYSALPPMVISRDGFFYESMDINSKIINVSYAGQEARILEIKEIGDKRWFNTEYGWFCTAIAYSCYTEEFQDTLQVNYNFLAVDSDLSGRVGPGMDFEVKKTLQQGQKVRIIETTRDGKWGFSTIYGWLELCNLVLVE